MLDQTNSGTSFEEAVPTPEFLIKSIAEQGYTLETVPPKGELVLLKTKVLQVTRKKFMSHTMDLLSNMYNVFRITVMIK